MGELIMLIVLALYAFAVWLVFYKFKWLPYTRLWKNTVWGGAFTIAAVVVGALQHYTPSTSTAVVGTFAQKIHPQVSGNVDEVYITTAQHVSKGDPLFQIDPRPFEYDLKQKKAALRLANIKLTDAKALVAKGAASKRRFDANQAERDQAEAAMKLAEFYLENTLITAPASGYISLNALKKGQYVSPKMAVFDFYQAEDIWITASIKQNGIERLRAGQNVMITFNTSPGNVYESEVLALPGAIMQGQLLIGNDLDILERLHTAKNNYPIKIKFPDSAEQHLRRPGTIASATVITDEGNPINILAVIIQWIGTWLDYIF